MNPFSTACPAIDSSVIDGMRRRMVTWTSSAPKPVWYHFQSTPAKPSPPAPPTTRANRSSFSRDRPLSDSRYLSV